MSYSTCLAQVKSILEGVTNIGQVHDYVRWNKDWPDLKTLFKVTSPTTQLRFWDITRKSSTEVTGATRTNERTHTFRIRGFITLDDSAATEKTFQNLVEDVATAFRNKPTLNGYALNVEPLQINNIDHAMVGDCLCHMCESEISIQEEVQWME